MHRLHSQMLYYKISALSTSSDISAPITPSKNFSFLKKIILISFWNIFFIISKWKIKTYFLLKRNFFSNERSVDLVGYQRAHHAFSYLSRVGGIAFGTTKLKAKTASLLSTALASSLATAVNSVGISTSFSSASAFYSSTELITFCPSPTRCPRRSAWTAKRPRATRSSSSRCVPNSTALPSTTTTKTPQLPPAQATIASRFKKW